MTETCATAIKKFTTKRDKEEQMKRIGAVVTPNFHRDIKIAAAECGTTMEEFIKESITERLKVHDERKNPDQAHELKMIMERKQ